MKSTVSFHGEIDDDDDDDEPTSKKDQESKKSMMRSRKNWMVNNKALMLRHTQDELLNCTNMHIPSLQTPITERSHGLIFKVKRALSHLN